jgi:hypothetical protein
MKTAPEHESVTTQRQELIGHLRELVEALDRRIPHMEREGEDAIARESAVLKRKAQERIAQLEAGPPR